MIERSGLTIAVAIATKGRPQILAEMLPFIHRQTHQPKRIMVAGTQESDIKLIRDKAGVEIFFSAEGTVPQRNILIDAAIDCDIMLFLDDDFLLDPYYIEATLAAFKLSDVVVTTGHVIADGIKGPGYDLAQGVQYLLADKICATKVDVIPVFNGYGCNMAVDLRIVRETFVRFDERMSSYAWYEDIDFTRRLAAYGRIVKVSAARGVHLGTKLGRTSGRRLGYTQVANPVYLARDKAIYPWRLAIASIARHLMINIARSVYSEQWVDRRGRAKGNLIALADLVRGRLTPERVNEL